MNEIDIEDFLVSLLDERKFGGHPVAAETFEESGLTTDERGVVLRVGDGSEFQLFIRQTVEGDES